MAKKADEEVHPSVDQTNRYPTDAWLRRVGFKIHSRRKENEPVWEKHGELYTQSQALEIARGRAKE